MYAIHRWRFPIRYLFQSFSERFHMYYRLSLWVLGILFLFYLHINPFCYLFPFQYFSPKLFCFICIQLLVCPHAFSSNLVDISVVILKCPVLIVLLGPNSVCFKSLFFRQYSCLISSSCIVRFICCFFLSFFPKYFHVFSILTLFACCRNFFFCPSSLISYSGFLFLFEFLCGPPILSLTNFTPT